MVIQEMKPRGNVKIFYDPTFWSFFHQGKFKPHLTLFLYLNHGMRFYFKGEGCNTLCYELSNPFH
jgi:hypothetical protein